MSDKKDKKKKKSGEFTLSRVDAPSRVVPSGPPPGSGAAAATGPSEGGGSGGGAPPPKENGEAAGGASSDLSSSSSSGISSPSTNGTQPSTSPTTPAPGGGSPGPSSAASTPPGEKKKRTFAEDLRRATMAPTKLTKQRNLLPTDTKNRIEKHFGLSADQVEELWDCFHLYDHNLDGKIPKETVAIVMRNVGTNPSLQDIEDIVGSCEDDEVDFEQLCRMMGKAYAINDGVEEMKQAFRVLFDRGGTGKISITELQHVVISMGEMLDEGEVDFMLEAADEFLDGEGMVAYSDFITSLLDK
ncbi:EF-hand domain-containing protein [Balamuthia mandrillaris]